MKKLCVSCSRPWLCSDGHHQTQATRLGHIATILNNFMILAHSHPTKVEPDPALAFPLGQSVQRSGPIHRSLTEGLREQYEN